MFHKLTCKFAFRFVRLFQVNPASSGRS